MFNHARAERNAFVGGNHASRQARAAPAPPPTRPPPLTIATGVQSAATVGGTISSST
jgi:hypothetical protein